MSFELETGVDITEREYKRLVEFIYAQSGINLGDKKKELVKARLGKRLKVYGFRKFQEYYEFVSSPKGSDELVEMLDAISTNVTSFFREKQHFDFLNRVALPEIINRKKQQRDNRIRAWSAACSTGEEVYTVMIALMDFLGQEKKWNVKVLATDISTKVLSVAKQGVYDYQKVKTVPPILLQEYFKQRIEGKEKTYQVKNTIKEKIVFRRLNLMDPGFPFKGKFDFIFCRNVMIYFDKETQTKVVDKLIHHLDVGGYLFIGHSESLAGFAKDRLKTLAPATFQKIC
ncbi:MAG: protein-glutamate O-methyltransferase [Candidatus Omnitrophica bacterium]|nr:protein-glutamate O-methyltransferase [Candidatus Omnitrophota bacterium]